VLELMEESVAEIKGRPKHIHSIFHKMHRKNVPLARKPAVLPPSGAGPGLQPTHLGCAPRGCWALWRRESSVPASGQRLQPLRLFARQQLEELRYQLGIAGVDEHRGYGEDRFLFGEVAVSIAVDREVQALA